MKENQFETELIQYITSGTITKPEHLEGIGDFVAKESHLNYVVKTKLWKYEPNIKHSTIIAIRSIREQASSPCLYV